MEDSSDDSDQEDDSPPPPLHTLTDEEWNTMRRHGRILIPRPRTVAPRHLLFDIRTATYTSDSTASYPDPSDHHIGQHMTNPRHHAPTLQPPTTAQLAQ